MKKIFSIFLLISLFSFGLPVFAMDKSQVEPPKWEDYVPEKYQNPREDFSRGAAISEMIIGIVLTDLLITAPVGIPMIVHSSTKFKNISYSEKKEIFFEGLEEAETIIDKDKKVAHYNKILRKCKFTESKKIKLAKKRVKEAQKEAKKAKKQAEKLEKETKKLEKIKKD